MEGGLDLRSRLRPGQQRGERIGKPGTDLVADMDERAEGLAEGHGRLAEDRRLLHRLELLGEDLNALEQGGGLGGVETGGGREHAAGLEQLAGEAHRRPAAAGRGIPGTVGGQPAPTEARHRITPPICFPSHRWLLYTPLGSW